MKYDVVVIGAGPSGSTAALNIAQYGKKVLLLDKEIFPREKPCGGGVPIRTLSRYPYIKTSNVIESYSYGGLVYSPENEKIEIEKSSPILAMVLRSKFDQYLVDFAKKQGVIFQDGMKVKNITISSDQVKIKVDDDSEIKTNLIIGADGMHSVVAKKTGLANIKKKYSGICILKEFSFPTAIIDEYFTKKRICHIHSKFGGIKGYGWIFPKKNHVNIGIVNYKMNSSTDHNQNIKKIFSSYIDYLIERQIIPSIEKDFSITGGVLPIKPLERTYSDRVLLCGDAAGLINPISGEGIHYAMVSGELAGKMASNAIEKNNYEKDFLSNYQKEWGAVFGKDIRIFLRSKNQWGKRGNKIIHFMKKDPEFAELIFLILVGKESVNDLKFKIVKKYLLNSIF